MKKLVSAAVITLGLSTAIAGVQTDSVSAAETLFKDVSERYGFYEEVEYLTAREVINGFPDGTFRPDEGITRAQAAIMLGRSLGFSGVQQDTQFSDVGRDSVASGYIAEAVKNNIISGYPDGTYRPGEMVTRGDMAILFDRAYQLPDAESENHFLDVSESMEAYDAIKNIANYHISFGYEIDRYAYVYRPNQVLKRGEFSAMMSRAEFPMRFSVLPEAQIIEILDVGTSDAILVSFPNDETMLIDTGSDPELLESALEELEYFRGNIDTLVLTHPDPDHIGNAAYIINQFDVKRVIDNGQVVDTPEYAAYKTALSNSDAAYEQAEIGDNLSDYNDISIEVLHTDNQSEDIDEGSIVLKINNDSNDILLTSDAGPETEAELLASGKNLQADILILSDNFGYNAGSQEFIDTVDPQDAFFSWSATDEDVPPAIFDTLKDRFTWTTISGNIRIVDVWGRGFDIDLKLG